MRKIVVFLALFAPALAQADCAAELSEAAQLACFDRQASCAAVVGDADRLACFHARGKSLSKPVGQAVTPAAPAPAQVASPAPAVAVPAHNAAIEQAYPAPRQAGDEPEAEAPEIEATIVAIQKDPHKYRYLSLSNGHVWREIEVSRNRYEEGDAVVIRKGALNSNQLIPAKGAMVRVKRVK